MRATYAKSGVDLRKVKSIQTSLATTLMSTYSNRKPGRGQPLTPIGHYAGLVDLGGDLALALHTDGVGSKLLIAQAMNRFDTVGIDCVAMTVNDLVCLGAEPVALLDYIALEKEDARLVGELTKGLVKGSKLSRTAIVGGETAIVGGMVNGFDLVSMGAGLVKKDDIVDGSTIVEGDVVVGVASSGLHSNGFTLARKILSGIPLDKRAAGMKQTLGEALLAPTRIYVMPALSAMKTADVHGVAHITGGSFSKLTRLVGSRKLQFELKVSPPGGIFALLKRVGGVSDREMFRTFNMGVGMALVVPEAEMGRVERAFSKYGYETRMIGKVVRGLGVRVNGMKLA